MKCVYDSFGHCRGNVTLYAHGGKCEAHMPPPNAAPDPTLTYEALRAKALATAPDKAPAHQYGARLAEYSTARDKRLALKQRKFGR